MTIIQSTKAQLISIIVINIIIIFSHGLVSVFIAKSVLYYYNYTA